MRASTFMFLLFLLFFTGQCRQTAPSDAQRSLAQDLPPPQTSREDPAKRLGEFFIAVQQSDLFEDSKTFVDCLPKTSDSLIVAQYLATKDQADFDLKAFFERYYELPPAVGADSKFVADTSRPIQEHIDALWDVLGREADQDIPGSTLIPLPNPYIVPGGRFREVYYWDSYFTMLGLIQSGRLALVRNMLDNFAFLIREIGHIPNGNRSYYNSRSQPPFFSAMVRLLVDEEGPKVWENYLEAMELEYGFWMEGLAQATSFAPSQEHVVLLDEKYILNRYWDALDTPRPEGYKEDLETAASSDNKEQVYRDLRSAAESGWDFSSRWFRDEKNIKSIHTTEIIPVDLNALLYHLEASLAEAWLAAGEPEKSEIYLKKSNERKEALLKYCWNAETGFFQDYDYEAQTFTPVLSLAGMYPLFFGLATQDQAQKCAVLIERDFLQEGGLLSTLNETGEQWDAPNGWAPLQWISVAGLKRYGLNSLGNTIRERWVNLNTRVYKNTGKLFEKYNVVDMGLEGGGGEYPTVEGFGWTNGVLMQFLSEMK